MSARKLHVSFQPQVTRSREMTHFLTAKKYGFWPLKKCIYEKVFVIYESVYVSRPGYLPMLSNSKCCGCKNKQYNCIISHTHGVPIYSMICVSTIFGALYAGKIIITEW